LFPENIYEILELKTDQSAVSIMSFEVPVGERRPPRCKGFETPTKEIQRSWVKHLPE
jgi:hypothetical protein